MGLFDNNNFMWFGTEQKMGWIITPNTGADVSSAGFVAEQNLLNGGAVVRNSIDSAKTYQFSWGETASPLLVSLIQAYRNGSYGRGNIYFHDPMFYHTNILPKRVADPSMAVNYEAEPLVPNANPTAVLMTVTENNYPVTAARYSLPANFSSQTAGAEHFIPIPEGMSLVVGASYTGPGQLYIRTAAGITVLPNLPLTGPVATTVINGTGAYLGIRNTTAAASQISIAGITARLSPAIDGSEPGEIGSGPWMSGEGHSGCEFVGNPTVINYNGVDGGQIGLSAVFREVGAWA